MEDNIQVKIVGNDKAGKNETFPWNMVYIFVNKCELFYKFQKFV